MDKLNITVDLLNQYISERRLRELRDIFTEYNIVDLASESERLPLASILFLFKILPKNISGQLFSYFDSDIKEQLIEAFTNSEIQEMLLNMYADDMVDFIEEMPANLVKKILSSVNKDQRNKINTLLSYPDYSAGSLMNTDFVELKESDTIAEALQKIKSHGKVAETISVCYITNSLKRLVGAIDLEDILFEQANDMVHDHMDSHVISCETLDDQEDIAQLFAKYDLNVLPVVNSDGCLIGIITIDDIIDVMEEEVTEDIQKMAAITPLEDSYLESSTFSMIKSRVPWLLILMLTDTFTGMIIERYEAKLQVIPALIAFIPMIMGSAGNAGNQTAVMIIRSMAMHEITVKDGMKVLFKEFQIGIICGVALFFVGMLRITLLPPIVGIDVALVTCFSLFIAICIGKLTGALLPFASLALKLDPAATSTPILTTIVDIISLFVYFTLCTNLLNI